jgi:PPIC-type PPIASE domain
MLELFRRYKGPVMWTLTGLIIISFSFWGAWDSVGRANQTGSPEDPAFNIYGRTYNKLEQDKLQRGMMLSYQLGLYNLAFQLPAAAERHKSTERGAPPYDFIANLLVLREQAVKHGVSASDGDAIDFVRNLQPFMKDNKPDEGQAAMIEQNLKFQGISMQDVLQLAKDEIALLRLQDLVGGNYSPSDALVNKGYANTNQTIGTTLITLALEDFKKAATVKDEEISKYFEENKEGYKTVEKRAASYVIFTKPVNDEKKKAEENQAATVKYEKAVSDFDTALTKPGADIAALVTALQKTNPEIKLAVVPAFERATPPEALKEEAALITQIFSPALASGSYTGPVETSKGYGFARITQVEAPKQQELKDVKDKIKETLVAQKANEAMITAYNAAHKELSEGLKANKKLEDIAKAKNWKLEAQPDFTPNNPPPGLDRGQEIAQAAAVTPVNSVAIPKSRDDKPEPIVTAKGATLIVVTKKVLFARATADEATNLKKTETSSQASVAKQDLFKAWFGKLRDEADLRIAL